jgi:hypothetical protein
MPSYDRKPPPMTTAAHAPSGAQRSSAAAFIRTAHDPAPPLRRAPHEPTTLTAHSLPHSTPHTATAHRTPLREPVHSAAPHRPLRTGVLVYICLALLVAVGVALVLVPSDVESSPLSSADALAAQPAEHVGIPAVFLAVAILALVLGVILAVTAVVTRRTNA